jgi:hypothetical protein
MINNMLPEIMPGIKIVDLGLYLEKVRAFIIADLHLGYEEMLNKQGVFIPRINFRDIKRRLRRMLEETKPKAVIINGDLKHEFGEISRQEWREVLEMLDFIGERIEQIVLIKGNHDTILGPLAKRKGLSILDELYITEYSTLVLHGHKLSESEEFKKAKTLIIAHEHAAVSLREGQRSELYKCFLRGKYKGKNLIVMPSMNAVAIGSDVLSEKLLSPFLQQELGEFECWLVEDKVYYFGKLRELD